MAARHNAGSGRYGPTRGGRKASTIAGYRALVRSQLLPAFGERRSSRSRRRMIERWLADVDRSSSTRTESLVLLHGIFERPQAVRPAGQSRRQRAL
jgi:hypothetical protein